MIGGARRLGRVIALDLAAHGADLAISTRAALADAESTCAAARSQGVHALAVAGDPGTAAGAAALVEQAAGALGGLDVLVYAASGPFRPAPPQNADLDDWQASFDVIARGFFVAARAARERFVAQAAGAAAPAAPGVTCGVVVALTDLLGRQPSTAFAGHSAAKAAQIMLVASLARAWGADGVRVCGVAPGPTALTDDPRADATLRAAQQAPLGRPVTPVEVAAVVRFAIECDALTGVDLPVDGGASL